MSYSAIIVFCNCGQKQAMQSYSVPGLCGIYDGDTKNDLTDKNTTVYTVTGINDEPIPFAKSWRLADSTTTNSDYDI